MAPSAPKAAVPMGPPATPTAFPRRFPSQPIVRLLSHRDARSRLTRRPRPARHSPQNPEHRREERLLLRDPGGQHGAPEVQEAAREPGDRGVEDLFGARSERHLDLLGPALPHRDIVETELEQLIELLVARPVPVESRARKQEIPAIAEPGESGLLPEKPEWVADQVVEVWGRVVGLNPGIARVNRVLPRLGGTPRAPDLNNLICY